MILLGLGSNLGKREQYLAEACTALLGFDIEIMAQSQFYETPALLPPGAPEDWDRPYLNQVVSVATHLPPHALLHCLKHIEAELGRKPAARWAPREIDIDLLSYNDEILVDEELTLPHPGLDTRRFVLEPLLEIAPHWRHPVLGKTPRELLAELPA